MTLNSIQVHKNFAISSFEAFVQIKQLLFLRATLEALANSFTTESCGADAHMSCAHIHTHTRVHHLTGRRIRLPGYSWLVWEKTNTTGSELARKFTQPSSPHKEATTNRPRPSRAEASRVIWTGCKAALTNCTAIINTVFKVNWRSHSSKRSSREGPNSSITRALKRPQGPK